MMDAASRDVTVLSDVAILVDAYRPSVAFWETIDMLRKLALVGLVVLVGRGSVAQIAAGTVLSFGFFALHVKVSRDTFSAEHGFAGINVQP
jgi:hypothetical protein